MKTSQEATNNCYPTMRCPHCALTSSGSDCVWRVGFVSSHLSIHGPRIVVSKSYKHHAHCDVLPSYTAVQEL